jgi:hypothetical protein
MSFKLALACWWTPERTLAEMLDRVATGTIAALDGILEKRSPGAQGAIRGAEREPEGGLVTRRAAMAAAHNARVNALVEALGRERAVREGREALFPVGVMLGKEAKKRLGVGDGPDDLERAARILYRALGIEFTLEKRPDGAMMMRVHRCALAGHYTPEACEVLSAADEGVVSGLNPKLAMRFVQRMTGGSAVCIACIREVGKCGP